MLHSASAGMVIDTEPPTIIINELGIFGNTTEESDLTNKVLYQEEYDAIPFSWNTTDAESGELKHFYVLGRVQVRKRGRLAR